MSLTLYWKPTKDSRVFITSDTFVDSRISSNFKLMELPTITFSIPTDVFLSSPIPDASFEFVLTYDNGHIFHGITEEIETDHYTGITEFRAVHVGNELEHRRVPTNYSIKELTLGELFTYDEYIRPAGLGEGGEIISNQKTSVNADGEKVTKTGNKTTTTTPDGKGRKVKRTVYQMSDGSTREVVSVIERITYGANNYKQTTTTTRPDGSVTQTVTTKNGTGSSKTEVTKSIAPPNKDNDDGISQQYVDVSKLDGMFNDLDWKYKFVDDSDDIVVTYLFSNQDKLQALTDICRQTENTFWRVSLTEERTIEIGRFGEYKQLMVNEQNLVGTTLLTRRDFTTITNYGIYLTDKSDSGTTALTLRDVYNRPYLQNPKFPVILTGQEVNHERNYNYIDLIPFGANNNGDYAVLDTEGVALEAGNIYEGSFTSNDVQPVAHDNKELSEADRLVASRQLYTQAIRKLIHSRRKIGYTFEIAELPDYYNVGDKLRLSFVDGLMRIEKCSNYYKKLMSVDDFFYLTELQVTTEVDGFTTYTLTVEKYLYNDLEV